MAVEEELKKDHSDMQAVVDSKQKIIEAQVPVCLSLSFSDANHHHLHFPLTCLPPSPVCLSGEEDSESRRRQHSPDGGSDSAEGAVRSDITEERPVS